MAGKKKVQAMVDEIVEKIIPLPEAEKNEPYVPAEKDLVEFEHFEETGLMYILHDVYKVQNHRVKVKREHIPFALAHGLKLVEK